MARARRNRSSNADLVEAALRELHIIRALYKLFEDERPVMVFDLQSQQVLAYPTRSIRPR